MRVILPQMNANPRSVCNDISADPSGLPRDAACGDPKPSPQDILQMPSKKRRISFLDDAGILHRVVLKKNGVLTWHGSSGAAEPLRHIAYHQGVIHAYGDDMRRHCTATVPNDRGGVLSSLATLGRLSGVRTSGLPVCPLQRTTLASTRKTNVLRWRSDRSVYRGYFTYPTPMAVDIKPSRVDSIFFRSHEGCLLREMSVHNLSVTLTFELDASETALQAPLSLRKRQYLIHFEDVGAAIRPSVCPEGGAEPKPHVKVTIGVEIDPRTQLRSKGGGGGSPATVTKFLSHPYGDLASTAELHNSSSGSGSGSGSVSDKGSASGAHLCETVDGVYRLVEALRYHAVPVTIPYGLGDSSAVVFRSCEQCSRYRLLLLHMVRVQNFPPKTYSFAAYCFAKLVKHLKMFFCACLGVRPSLEYRRKQMHDIIPHFDFKRRIDLYTERVSQREEERHGKKGRSRPTPVIDVTGTPRRRTESPRESGQASKGGGGGEGRPTWLGGGGRVRPTTTSHFAPRPPHASHSARSARTVS